MIDIALLQHMKLEADKVDPPAYFHACLFSLDVNECEENETDLCFNNGTCVNTNGSYYCMCAEGWTGYNCTSGENPICAKCYVHLVYKTRIFQRFHLNDNVVYGQ